MHLVADSSKISSYVASDQIGFCHMTVYVDDTIQVKRICKTILE